MRAFINSSDTGAGDEDTAGVASFLGLAAVLLAVWA
jgi:hypothetical protein